LATWQRGRDATIESEYRPDELPAAAFDPEMRRIAR
jgi:hypothetical protein